MLLDGFAVHDVLVGDTTIHARVGGSGPPVLLLHGWPQTHAMWAGVAPELARDFTVVATDLTGYGASGKPASTADHGRHSKRAFAGDQVEVMGSLGFERFAVVGHDRGARTAYRMALDHPDRVTRVVVLDVLPTVEALAKLDADRARAVWWWFVLGAPYPIPERLLHGDPETVHAMCEDYRAMFTVDRAHDEADAAAGRRITAPLLALWGTRTQVGRDPEDPLTVWRRWADDVQGHAFDCGHDLPREAPEQTLQTLRAFLSA
jgi:haloacetate dehalogenase